MQGIRHDRQRPSAFAYVLSFDSPCTVTSVLPACHMAGSHSTFATCHLTVPPFIVQQGISSERRARNAPPWQAALTCHHLPHPLHCIHHALALSLALDGRPLAAQDLAIRHQAHHQLVPQTGCLHTAACGSAPAEPTCTSAWPPFLRCHCLCNFWQPPLCPSSVQQGRLSLHWT